MATGVTSTAVAVAGRGFAVGLLAGEPTGDKARTAAAEPGYRPNLLARAMVSGRGRIDGLVVMSGRRPRDTGARGRFSAPVAGAMQIRRDWMR